MIPLQGDSDASLALECYQSAQATLECLRRILTAYDAVCQSESGRQFYQVKPNRSHELHASGRPFYCTPRSRTEMNICT